MFPFAFFPRLLRCCRSQADYLQPAAVSVLVAGALTLVTSCLACGGLARPPLPPAPSPRARRPLLPLVATAACFLPLVVGLCVLAPLLARRSVPARVPCRWRGSSLGRAPLRSLKFGCSRSLRPAGAWLPLCSFPLACGLRSPLSVRHERPFLSPAPLSGAILRPLAVTLPFSGSLRASVLGRPPLDRSPALRAVALSSGGARSSMIGIRFLRGLCPQTPGNTS